MKARSKRKAWYADLLDRVELKAKYCKKVDSQEYSWLFIF